MRVFVTGATGALGSAAVRRLVAGGHRVTGVARTAEKRGVLIRAGAAAVEADLFDRRAVSRVLDGHDVLCNLATRIPTGRAAAHGASWQENDRIRGRASAVLAQAAADCGALRLIQEAVALVYRDAGEEWITERSPVDPAGNLRSSMQATENAMAFDDGSRFAVVLRFGALYGADANTRWQSEQVRRGRAAVDGDPASYLSPITVEDAAAAVVAALAAPSGIYNVADVPVRRAEWARALGTAAGIDGSARFVSERRFPPRRRGRASARSLRISSDAFHAATGWRARTPLAEGFAGLP